MSLVATPSSTAPSKGSIAAGAGLIASPWHTLLVLAVQGYLSYRGAVHVGHSLANPDRMHLYTRTIVFQWLMLGLVLVGVWLHGSSLHSVMGERWRSLRQLFSHIGI